MNLPVYNGTFFFFQAPLLIRILREFQTKISYAHVTKIPRDDGVLSEPTTEVNGNDPYCKRVCVHESYALPTELIGSVKSVLVSTYVMTSCLTGHVIETMLTRLSPDEELSGLT